MRDIMKQIGRRLRILRKKRGHTQEQLAEKAGINATYYGRVERGEANISLDLLLSVAEAFGMPLDELLHTEPEKDREQMLSELAVLLDRASDAELKLLYRLTKDVLD